MIITITCNPAIDKTNINDKTYVEVGGKGINVSKALHTLNENSLALGFVGENDKDLFEDNLNKYNIDYDFIFFDGKTRVNTKTIKDNHLIEDNEIGKEIDDSKLQKLKNKLNNYRNEIIVISGSAPVNVRKTYYYELIEICKKNNCFVILDSSKELLKNGIDAIPNVIKPNKDEFCELYNIEYSKENIINKAKELINLGIQMVIVSLGKDGALFICKDYVYDVNPIDVNYVSSLCSGDSMVAAVAFGIKNNLVIEEIIKLSIALASASVEEVGVATNIDKVNDYIKKVSIYKNRL